MLQKLEYKCVERKVADDLIIVTMNLPQEGMIVGQHAHEYDHYTMVAKGKIRVWNDGNHIGDYEAPEGVLIKAHEFHEIMSLEDDTLAYCIHNSHQSDEVAVKAENNFEDSYAYKGDQMNKNNVKGGVSVVAITTLAE